MLPDEMQPADGQLHVTSPDLTIKQSDLIQVDSGKIDMSLRMLRPPWR